MNELKNIYEKGNQIFDSGFIWFCTNIILAILPTFLSCLYQIISTDKEIKIIVYIKDYFTGHFTDILLLVFSISCNLFTLSINKDKLIHIYIKKITISISVILFVISGSFYFFLVGCEKTVNNVFIYIISMFCIFFCSIMGWLIESKHDKYNKEKAKCKEK